MKPNMKEKAKASKQTNKSCCQVNLIDFKILSRSYIFANANINVNEYTLT
jgi:hypothetical protein